MYMQHPLHPQRLLGFKSDRKSSSRYGSGMLLVSESRVPPRGHHAIDKDAAAIMRIKNVMISTLPAIPFLPNLLFLNVPSQAAQLKPGMIYLVHCTQYT